MKIRRDNIIFIILIVVLAVCYGDRISRLSDIFIEFDGKIISKEIGGRGTPAIRLNNEDRWVDFLNSQVYSAIDTGDYIIKKAWSLQFKVIKKNNDTIVFK